MKYITGQDRNQIPLFALSMEASIAPDNEVRLIDVFEAYNMQRIVNIIGFDSLNKWHESLVFRFFEQFFSFLRHTITYSRLPKN